ncbi:MAG: hypothetical protein H0T72_12770 [Chloroflexia bacterium]|jgi:hypothetical protein|nr:hypothetical protein [Chloroflexia bacterium]
MSPFYVALAIGLVLVVLGIQGIARRWRFWGPAAIVLAIVIVIFGYWSDVEIGEDVGDEPIPGAPALPAGDITHQYLDTNPSMPWSKPNAGPG